MTVSAYALEMLTSIDCLYQAKRYSASPMLTYAVMDQMAWLSKPGDTDGRDFVAWVDKFLLGDRSPRLSHVKASDLWGARNGLIHMNVATSRDYLKGKARKIYYTYGDLHLTYEGVNEDTIIINLTDLISYLAQAILWFMDDLEKDEVGLQIANAKINSMFASHECPDNFDALMQSPSMG